MFSKVIIAIAILCVVVASANSPEVEFSPEDVKNALILEGLSNSGAAEFTEFLYKDRSDDITAIELKTEFRQFLEKLSLEDKLSIKRIISRELERFFHGNGFINGENPLENHSFFLV
ncbi:hypothetical protein L3Y34_008652 [Caenorhabditis briggsae]|uniref:Uncharacterized protein n=1 Tax=Caenorhabditis briggsae TaxID=6238 RepID=A0AAE9AA79_CAEBR|nr:hypothetical protein L3Y34_008652 [Caenorhabditis briggsae]